MLRKIVSDYNPSGNPGQFVVRKGPDGRLSVVGVSIKDATGTEESVGSVLDTRV